MLFVAKSVDLVADSFGRCKSVFIYVFPSIVHMRVGAAAEVDLAAANVAVNLAALYRSVRFSPVQRPNMDIAPEFGLLRTCMRLGFCGESQHVATISVMVFEMAEKNMLAFPMAAD